MQSTTPARRRSPLPFSKLRRIRIEICSFRPSGSSDLTGKSCSPTSVHWTYDTYALAQTAGKAMIEQGGDSWFFITADYAFGHALERDTAAIVRANGGKVLGAVRHPQNTPDLSSYLL